MAGLFGGGGRRGPTQAEKDAQAAQKRSEERAEAQERTEDLVERTVLSSSPAQ